MLSTRPSGRGSGDDGSLVLATVVVLVVGLIGASLLTRSADEVRRSRRDTQRVQALALAERSAAEAIDAVAGGAALPASGSGTSQLVEDATYVYEAAATDGGAVVRGEATVGGATRAVEVELVRTGGLVADPTYPSERFALFADRSLELSGWSVVPGGAATNHSMVLDGLFSGTAVLAGRHATCVGCRNPQQLGEPVPIPAVFVPPGPTRDCPAGQRFAGTVDGGGGEPYVCDEPHTTVRFATGIVTVENPPLIVYVGEGVALNMNNSWVNPFGASDAVRITRAGEGHVRLHDTVISGLLHMPETSVDVHGFVTIDGSLMVDELSTHKHSTLLFLGDSKGSSLPFGRPPASSPARWEVVSWRTVAAG